MAEAAELDRRAIETFGDALAETGGALVIASGLIGVATEEDRPDPAGHPRLANAAATLALADRGVRSIVVRFAPTVHGPGDYGFVAVLTEIAARTGVAAYIDDGANHWPAVHRLDAAALVRLAVESAPAGTVLHAAAEPGIPTREIAEAIGRVGSACRRSRFPPRRRPSTSGGSAAFFGIDMVASSDLTRELLGWAPTHPGLLADLEAGSYAAVPTP